MTLNRLVTRTLVVCATLATQMSASAKGTFPLNFGQFAIEQAWARLETGSQGSNAKVYFTIHNRSGADDYLLAVDSPSSASSMIHEASQQPVPGGLRMPSHGEIVMRPDDFHIALTGISGDVRPGGVLPVRVILRDAEGFDLSIPILRQEAEDPPIVHNGHGV